jgi:hypothetical protein
VFEIIVRNIVTIVTGGIDNVVFAELRECIYDLFVYDADIHLCMWSILSTLIKTDYINPLYIDVCVENTFEFFKLYNNNYRPIYHVEAYLYKTMILMHEQEVTQAVEVVPPANIVVSYDTPVLESNLIKDIDTCEA